MIPDFLREAFDQADHDAADFVRHQVRRQRALAQKPAPALPPPPPVPPPTQNFVSKDFVFELCGMLGGEAGKMEARMNRKIAELEAKMARDPLADPLPELPDADEDVEPAPKRDIDCNVINLPGNPKRWRRDLA
jgi:hypothetical protein